MRTERRKLLRRFGLPLAYEQLKYIENPSVAYILIPNLPIKDSMIVETDFLLNTFLGDCTIFQMFVGIDANKTEVNVSSLQIGWTGSRFSTKRGKTGIKIKTPVPKYGVDWKFVFSKLDNKNQNVLLNGNQISVESYYYGDSTLIGDYDNKETFKLLLFTSYNFIKPFRTRIYNFICSADGKRIVQLIPCKRKSDGVVGMYDLVGRKFYTSPNGVAFTGG